MLTRQGVLHLRRERQLRQLPYHHLVVFHIVVEHTWVAGRTCLAGGTCPAGGTGRTAEDTSVADHSLLSNVKHDASAEIHVN